MLDEDYKKAGFKMLPTGKKDKGTAVQIIMYTVWMIIISVIPAFGITGRLQLSIAGGIVIFLMGMAMLVFAFRLFEKRDNASARKLMLASVSYISLMQLVYVADKFI
jgi:protoheme IX farnesyltransferase